MRKTVQLPRVQELLQSAHCWPHRRGNKALPLDLIGSRFETMSKHLQMGFRGSLGGKFPRI